MSKKKGEHPSTQGVYKGWNNQEQKLQESKKSRKDKNDWFRNAANQSIKVLKKNSFKSDMEEEKGEKLWSHLVQRCTGHWMRSRNTILSYSKVCSVPALYAYSFLPPFN